MPKLDMTSTTANDSEIPLPPDLKRILREVAGSGACTWLSWDADDTDLVLNSVLEPGGTLKSLPTVKVSRRTTHSSTYLGTPPAYFSSSLPEVHRRKKMKTILIKSNQRLWASRDPSTVDSNSKRPPLVVKTLPHTTADTKVFPSLSSVGADGTSGSEPDDSTHFEWDSEETSSSTNSDSSLERLRKNRHCPRNDLQQTMYHQCMSLSVQENQGMVQSHGTLQEAFRIAVGIVLDHFYQNMGGYKLSPAEKGEKSFIATRRKTGSHFSINELSLTPEDIFIQRRRRLTNMLQPRRRIPNKEPSHQNISGGPPFTLQRIAEVLISPERVSHCVQYLLLISLHLG